jgi:hypothetical protein
VSHETNKSRGNFVGFQFDLGGDKIPVLQDRTPGTPLLQLSPSRVMNAAQLFLNGNESAHPKDEVLPPRRGGRKRSNSPFD